MIHSLEITGYRGFDHFEMAGLGPITLLVGTNNSGKTSVLEALYLLATAGDPVALWTLMSRRGERLHDERDPRHPQVELDVCHLFRGHEIKIGAKFHLTAKNQTPERTVTYSIGESDAKQHSPDLFPPEDDAPIGPRMALHIKGGIAVEIPLTRRGGLVSDSFDTPRRYRRGVVDSAAPAQYISTDSMSSDELVRLWDKIALTDAEAVVLRALQCLDPTVERIAALSASRYFGFPSRGGFILKQKNFELPIPIGSMGDGMWRMLAMAIAIMRSRGGVLLVDEIDTGLHYTVMADMWKLIAETAEANNVQVFATTHSYDCVKSLASICQSNVAVNSRVTIQRIELKRRKSVPYTEAEIKIAAERHIEVR